MFGYIILEILAATIGILALLYIAFQFVRQTSAGTFIKSKKFWIPLVIFIVVFFVGMFGNKTYAPHFAMPTWMHSEDPHHHNPAIPVPKIVEFLKMKKRLAVVENIGADPNNVPLAINRAEPALVEFDLTAREVIAEIAPGISFNYWTYDGQVPGPMLRARVGDTIRLTLHNHPSSLHHHNIDLHAVTGPGGGATLTHVAPGESKTFEWKALNPGLYVYHCAMPNVSTHNSHGQYGLILIEPEEGLSPVDKEFYLMQGELYTVGDIGKRGLVPFDAKALIDGMPNYVTFNGIIEQEPRMQIRTGEKVRIYIGNGGVNLISSFHAIGEIFDEVYPEAAIGSETHKNIQTTAVLPGGASIVEFVAEVPGDLILVDHALARMNKGAWAIMNVTGTDRPDIYKAIESNYSSH